VTEIAASAPLDRPRLDDRINPILVKEVRQALRGRYFRWLFWLTLLVATMIGLTIVAGAVGNNSVGMLGQAFFMAMFGCMAAAVQGFVPFSAFLATSAEWDENTYDLLVISNLRPRQIVYGKLLSALIQALLYYSTFGPFLVFAFLMNGVDLLSVIVILIGSMATCVALSLVGIAASSLASAKVVRVLLMAFFGAFLIAAWIVSFAFAMAITNMPQQLRSASGQTAVVAYLSCAFVVGLLASAVAMARFSHEEENRSTPLRLLCSFVLVAATVWGGVLFAQFHDVESVWVCQAIAGFACFFLWLFLLSEPEELGRRVEQHLPQKRALAWLSVPFLPGGGRGVLLFLAQATFALIGGQVALLFGHPTAGQSNEVFAVTLVLYAYLFLYVALPSGVIAWMTKSAALRTFLRVAVVIGVPVSILAPALLGIFLGNRSWMNLEHPLNPFWVLSRVASNDPFANVVASLVLLGVACALTLLINLPRLLAGTREVRDALARRDAARAAAAS
jgi:hypothetical protein